MERLHLHRLQFPAEPPPRYVAANCLFSLASQRPDLYCLWQASQQGGIDPAGRSPAALIIRQYGDFRRLLAELLRLPQLVELLEDGLPLILDNSTEAGFCTPALWRDFRLFLESFGFRRLHLLVLQQHALSTLECEACFRDHAQLRVQALVFHHWLHRTVMAFRGTAWDPFERARRLHPPRARYLCLNGRLRQHRAVLVGRLAARDLLREGLVSIAPFRAASPHPAPSGGEADPGIFLESCRQEFPDWGEDLEAYRGVMSSGLQIADELQQPVDFGGSAASLLPHLHIQSQFSLVVETEMTAGQILRFTEKSLRPLANLQPLLIAGNPGALKLLRSHGFQTFSPWIDESYDLEPNPSRRLELVLDQAERLIRMPSGEFADLITAMAPVVRHNRQQFVDGLEGRMEQQHADLIAAVTRLRPVRTGSPEFVSPAG